MEVFHPAFTCSKSAKKHNRATRQIYIKLRRHQMLLVCLVLLLLTLNLFRTYSTVITAEFKQINGSWAWETIVSDHKFIFSTCGTYIVLWVWNICWTTCFQFYSHNIRFWKGKFLRQCFQKISQTLKRELNISLILKYYHVHSFVRFLSDFVTNDENSLNFILCKRIQRFIHCVSSQVIISNFFCQAYSRSNESGIVNQVFVSHAVIRSIYFSVI